MNKMTQTVKNNRTLTQQRPVVNFMGGISYEINPLDTLKMVTASSIFGEPQYYRHGEFAEKTSVRDGEYHTNPYFKDYTVIPEELEGLKTSDIMEQVIDASLKHNFLETLEWAVELRNNYLMRLNPQIIMVRAAMMTDERKEFTKTHPGLFHELNMKVMSRADDVISQITYYLFKVGKKNAIPGILKHSWAKKISSLTEYEMAKYKNKGIGLIDAIRICHAKGTVVDTLVKTGTVEVASEDKTWETLRASGMSWEEILDTIKMNHMALLRNLRGIFSEIDNIAKVDKLLTTLKNGVKFGKQFPFRYMSAQKAVQGCKNISNSTKTAVNDALEDCLDIACDNLPKLKGNNAFLSDNSGSAWGTCTSEYGTVTVAEIDNLSCVIGAANSERGTVFKFGDRLKAIPISKRAGILQQARHISDGRHSDVGGGTENGIWLFFRDAIDEKIHYDNIFIYSDMQAGHGGLYGTDRDYIEYKDRGFVTHGKYIDVAKLINEYRKTVNPKVNVFCVQTAGYNNVLVPEYGYRTNILYGWTGKELVFADIMNKFWDDKDAQKQQ